MPIPLIPTLAFRAEDCVPPPFAGSGTEVSMASICPTPQGPPSQGWSDLLEDKHTLGGERRVSVPPNLLALFAPFFTAAHEAAPTGGPNGEPPRTAKTSGSTEPTSSVQLYEFPPHMDSQSPCTQGWDVPPHKRSQTHSAGTRIHRRPTHSQQHVRASGHTHLRDAAKCMTAPNQFTHKHMCASMHTQLPRVQHQMHM